MQVSTHRIGVAFSKFYASLGHFQLFYLDLTFWLKDRHAWERQVITLHTPFQLTNTVYLQRVILVGNTHNKTLPPMQDQSGEAQTGYSNC